MLGTIVFLMCVVASVAAVAIVFILYGPVPVRRKVTIIPRIAAPDPFVDQPAARMIALPAVVPAPAMSAYAMPSPYAPHATSYAPHAMSSAPHAMSSAPHARSSAPHAMSSAPHARSSAPSPASSRPRAGSPDVAPLVLRRPGNPNPPLSRARAARGTEPRPRPSTEEMQAIDEADLDDPTSQVTLVEHDEFIEDGR